MWSAGHHPATLYNMELCYASAVAMGAALARPDRRAIAIEGDGSLLAGLPILATVARHAPVNLTILAVVNGIYGTGDNRTPTQFALGADLIAVARGLGWPADHAVPADTVGALSEALEVAVSSDGPWLIAAGVDPGSYGTSGSRPRPGLDVVDAATAFRLHLAADSAG
jgi:thiamine pyrophosphate-dependent acetolactate synthase large subunit-like protein